MDKKYIEYLATLELTTFHYKILLLLNSKPYTQAQIAEILEAKKQNINKHFKELESLHLIEVDREEGRNKFYRPIINLKLISQHMKGQQSLLK